MRRAHLPPGMHRVGTGPHHSVQAGVQESTHRALRRLPGKRAAKEASFVERQELLSVFCFAIREPLVQRFFRKRAMLKATFGENRHLKSSDGPHSTRNDLTLQFI